MYAIVDIAGQQFKVQKSQRVYVHRLEANEGANVEFDKVLLLDNNGKITVGAPTVDGARVAAKVLQHLKDEKVLVFKKKRRKGYKKLNGHRQYLSEILVQAILGKGETLKAEDANAAPAKKATKAKKAETTEAKAEKKATTKKVATKKTVASTAKAVKSAAKTKKTTK